MVHYQRKFVIPEHDVTIYVGIAANGGYHWMVENNGGLSALEVFRLQARVWHIIEARGGLLW